MTLASADEGGVAAPGGQPAPGTCTPLHASRDCLPCLARQAAEAIALSVDDPARQAAILAAVTRELAAADLACSPPQLARHLHRIIRTHTGVADPYLSVKQHMNRLASGLLPRCRQWIAAAPDPRAAVVRLAVAGNLLDCGAQDRIEPEELPRLFSGLWSRPLAGDPQDLFQAAGQAASILYLADNAGEIVFDRLLIEALPHARVTLAVRGRPVLNDALAADAALAGVTGLVPVIDNGSDVPGTLLEDCSEAFRERFRSAGLVIAKGQGNYETLAGVAAPVFFLFTAKCPLVASHVGAPVGALVARRSAAWRDRAAPCQPACPA